MTDPFAPGAAFDAFLPGALATSRAQRDWTPQDGALPALYLSHGAPPLFDDGEWMDQLLAWAQKMPKPKSILIISAHWESAPLSITSPFANTPLVYDFGGFAQRYFEMEYATPDAAELARLVSSVMPDVETVHQHNSRGLDHGAWVPLKTMYPLGDVPVLQLSIPTHDPAKLMDLGRRLRPLREQGVLIIGSGFMTHGLPFLTRDAMMGKVPGWSSDFDSWAQETLARGDVDTLMNYLNRAPGLPYSHPTVEHFVPAFITLGAATDPEAPVTTTIEGWMWGLSKRSFQVA
ncbi:dioxygenase family protein [Kineosporia succinea]|uniref:4,5-DOPA dioxygenase extradiol n=1 Tax=Kineosporia succinea TaxID=84632 RepID=A0ABT9P389_9ACTN|nr:class III extradiol ring-cleavage dioxygenase [Kineosporia succinea]MDP9827149.1 4,5-DOPA dioxygenase extradiol [Kineosporia succinea]